MSGTPAVAPCTPQQVAASDGALVRFCTHGGHVLGWTPAGGTERLWLSRDTGCGPGAAIRGGIPVVWPQFAERGGGPRHGVARDRAWTLLHAGTDGEADGGRARVHLQLRSDAATRALFPHPFTLDLHIEAAGDELTVRLGVRNEGVDELTFTAALHGYLRVSSTARARVGGLEGLSGRHNDDGATVVLPQAPLAVEGGLDLAVAGAAEVELQDPVLGDLVLTADGFDSWVVWNPGPDHVPADVHPGGEAEFVCVEPARLAPVSLPPGQSWSGVQVLRVVVSVCSSAAGSGTPTP